MRDAATAATAATAAITHCGHVATSPQHLSSQPPQALSRASEAEMTSAPAIHQPRCVTKIAVATAARVPAPVGSKAAADGGVDMPAVRRSRVCVKGVAISKKGSRQGKTDSTRVRTGDLLRVKQT